MTRLAQDLLAILVIAIFYGLAIHLTVNFGL